MYITLSEKIQSQSTDSQKILPGRSAIEDRGWRRRVVIEKVGREEPIMASLTQTCESGFEPTLTPDCRTEDRWERAIDNPRRLPLSGIQPLSVARSGTGYRNFRSTC